jgi:hypothetical protein
VLRTRADRAGSAGEGLQAIDTGAWEGPAARAFHDKFSYEPGKWFAASDALESAAGGLQREDLTPDQQANLQRYQKKLPPARRKPRSPSSTTARFSSKRRFLVAYQARQPPTPRSSEDGTTVGHTKTTTLPDGSIAHVKDKMPK